jgi:hypothetical protein
MFLDGEIVEVGIGEWNDGVSIEIDGRAIAITGLTKSELREFGRMLYHRVTIKIESKDDRAQAAQDQPAPPPQSNIDEATGIAKTGEI